MANNIIKRIWNQNKMVNIEALQGIAFQAEDGGHTFEISGIDDSGAAVSLTGTVAGVFRRADNADIALTGSASDGVVSVTLTDDCYAVPGRFALTVFVTTDSKKTAVYAAVGTVASTSGGAVAGSTPQDVVDLINDIAAAVATIPASYTDLMGAIAPTYSNTALYAVGAYAWYNGSLYRCNTAITTAESWTASHWTRAALGNDLTDLAGVIDDITSVGSFADLNGITITYGSYLKHDGTIGSNSILGYSDYIELPIGVQSVTVNRKAYTSTKQQTYNQYEMVWWYDPDKNLLGTGTNTTSDNILTSKKGASWNAKYIRVNFAKYHVTPYVCLNYSDALRYIRPKQDDDSADSFTETGFYFIASTTSGFPSPSPGILTVKKITDSIIEQTFITESTTYTRIKNGEAWSSWVNETNPLLVYTGASNYSFSSTASSKYTGIYLEPNKTYRLIFVTPRNGQINVYGQGNSGNYVKVNPYQNTVYFTNDENERQLVLYNIDAEADSGTVLICKTDNRAEIAQRFPRIYTVGKDTNNLYDFDSITACLLALKDDTSPKTIEIYEGEYDIYQEYVDSNVPVYTGSDPSLDYFNYCVWVPVNTHIIGKGIVRLKWMPDPSIDNITPNQCKCVSPLNVAASCTIENIEVYCKNGRYCLHNDALGKKQYRGAVQKYINCRFVKYANDVDSVSGESYGFFATTGFGIDRDMHHVYENCTFIHESTNLAFYGHSRNSVISSEVQSSDITLSNCVIKTGGNYAVKFGNPKSTSHVHIRVMFNSCYISGTVRAVAETDNGDCINGFDVQYLNCGDVSMQIKDADNPYPPQAYNTTLTMVN